MSEAVQHVWRATKRSDMARRRKTVAVLDQQLQLLQLLLNHKAQAEGRGDTRRVRFLNKSLARCRTRIAQLKKELDR